MKARRSPRNAAALPETRPSGRGVHLITVNDYLARFQAEWMVGLHQFLGLKVGTIIPDNSTV